MKQPPGPDDYVVEFYPIFWGKMANSPQNLLRNDFRKTCCNPFYKTSRTWVSNLPETEVLSRRVTQAARRHRKGAHPRSQGSEKRLLRNAGASLQEWLEFTDR
jgi:hypothetical protein